MVDLLTDIGEEWIVENNIDGASITVGLYEDATDTLGEGSTLSDITTEPTGSNYARQSSPVTTGQISGNFGADNDNGISFDTSDSSQTVDAAFVVVSLTRWPGTGLRLTTSWRRGTFHSRATFPA